jgi:light-regulated signal transduction histidine kinase (bacteriophytochrome)
MEELALVGRLASRLSGETRQPLGVLRNAVYFLNQQLGDSIDQKARYHLTLMLRSVESLDGMVLNLAALAGVDLQERQTADVQMFVDAAIGRVDTRPGVVIETAVAPQAVIFCDPSSILQALTNVILNSAGQGSHTRRVRARGPGDAHHRRR